MKLLRVGLVLVLLTGPVALQRADQPSGLPTQERAQTAQTTDQKEATAPAKLPPIEVHFSPKGGCTEAVVKEMNAAKNSILVQAYSFTSVAIAKALVEAHERGVRVEVILDKSSCTKNYSAADFVQHAGISAAGMPARFAPGPTRVLPTPARPAPLKPRHESGQYVTGFVTDGKDLTGFLHLVSTSSASNFAMVDCTPRAASAEWRNPPGGP
jgi:hypothetical protein